MTVLMTERKERFYQFDVINVPFYFKINSVENKSNRSRNEEGSRAWEGGWGKCTKKYVINKL